MYVIKSSRQSNWCTPDLWVSSYLAQLLMSSVKLYMALHEVAHRQRSAPALRHANKQPCMSCALVIAHRGCFLTLDRGLQALGRQLAEQKDMLRGTVKQSNRGTDKDTDRQTNALRKARKSRQGRQQAQKSSYRHTDIQPVHTGSVAEDKHKPAAPCRAHSPSHQRLRTLLRQRC